MLESRGCLQGGRLGLPGQVWELTFLPSFPSFPRKKSLFKKCLGKHLDVPNILLPDIRGLRKMGEIANRQSLVFSERGQLSQAIPQVYLRILRQRTSIAQFESQRNERRVYEDQILCL